MSTREQEIFKDVFNPAESDRDYFERRKRELAPAGGYVAAMNLNTSQTRYNQYHAWDGSSATYLCGLKASPTDKTNVGAVSCILCRKKLQPHITQVEPRHD